jgi:hypothetical protein
MLFREIIALRSQNQPNVVVERLTLLLRIRKVPTSNLGQETGHPDRVFRDIPQSLQANAGTEP